MEELVKFEILLKKDAYEKGLEDIIKKDLEELTNEVDFDVRYSRSLQNYQIVGQTSKEQYEKIFSNTLSTKRISDKEQWYQKTVPVIPDALKNRINHVRLVSTYQFT